MALGAARVARHGHQGIALSAVEPAQVLGDDGVESLPSIVGSFGLSHFSPCAFGYSPAATRG